MAGGRQTTWRAPKAMPLVATLAIALSGCGSAPSASTADARAAELRIAAVDAQIVGTAQQALDGVFLDYVRSQSEITACFAKRGLRYLPAPFELPERADPADEGLTSPIPVALTVDVAHMTARVDRGLEQSRALARAQATLGDSRYRSPDADDPGFDAAATACAPVTKTPERFRTAINTAWTDLLVAAGQVPGAQLSDASYVACMTSQGQRATSAQDAFGPYPELSDATLRRSEARAKMVARAAADSACRRSAHDAFILEVDRQLAQFTQTHGEQIETSRRAWERLSTEAETARKSWYAAHPTLPRS